MSDDAGVLTGSAGLIETQIKNWVRTQVCVTSKEMGRCKKVVLRHLSVDRKPMNDVHSVNIASDAAFEGTEIADKVILEITEAALRDANDLKGVQTYGIYAYYTGDPNWAPRKIFRVSADEDFDPESGPSEPPTEKGIVAQLMRHNEINSKNSLVAMGYIITTFQKEIGEQRAMNKTFMEQQIETAMFIQDVMNDAHKRRIEERKAEVEMTVMEGVFEHLKIILPIIANKLAGREIVPSSMPPEFMLFASLLENLSDQQQTILRDMLNPQQLTVLAELLGAYEKKKAKLFGDKPPSDEDGEPPRSTGTTTIATKPQNRLATLFEKRSLLVKKDNRFEVKDDFTRDMEDRAEKIKRKMSDAMSKIVNDNKKE